jgi:predicted nucleotidyltransferase
MTSTLLNLSPKIDRLFLAIFESLDAGNRERLYSDHPDLLTDDFDYVLAGAELLGRDISSSVSSTTKMLIIEILEAETDVESQSRLAEDMSRRPSTIPFEQNLEMLLPMMKGVSS